VIVHSGKRDELLADVIVYLASKDPSLYGKIVSSLERAEIASLKELWSYKTGDAVIGLAFSTNGNLGAASVDNCYYVFDPSGSLLNKVCGGGGMSDASSFLDMFGFINADNYAYIANEDGTLWKKIHVDWNYDSAITMLPDGFVACFYNCAYFGFNGNKKWDVDVGVVENGPSVYKGYVYVADADWKKLLVLRLSDGSEVKEISYDEDAEDTAVCGNYLAAVTYTHVHLYNLSDPVNPKEVWNVGGIGSCRQVTFSPGCKYIAIAEWGGQKLRIYDIQGNEVLEKSYGNEVTAVAWFEDRIAVGLRNGEIHVYEVVYSFGTLRDAVLRVLRS